MLLQSSDATITDSDNAALQNSKDVLSDFGPNAAPQTYDGFGSNFARGLGASAVTLATGATDVALGPSKFAQDNFGDAEHVLDETFGTKTQSGNDAVTQQLLSVNAGLRAASNAIAPDPANTNLAGKIMFGAGNVAGTIAAAVASRVVNPLAPLGVLFTSAAANEEQNLAEKGVAPLPATLAAIKTGIINSAPFSAAGMVEGTLAKIALGGTAQVALGAGDRASTSAILDHYGYHDMAQQYKALDGDAVISDLILGMGFGGHEALNTHLEAIAEAKRAAMGKEPSTGGEPPAPPAAPFGEHPEDLPSLQRLSFIQNHIDSAAPLPGFDPTTAPVDPIDEVLNVLRDGGKFREPGDATGVVSPTGEVIRSSDRLLDHEGFDTPARAQDAQAATAADPTTLQDDRAQNLRDQIAKDMNVFIDRNGIDLKKASNEQIKELIDLRKKQNDLKQSGVQPSDVDAAAVVQDAKQFEDSSPGVPADLESRTAHASAMQDMTHSLVMDDKPADISENVKGTKFIERPTQTSDIMDMLEHLSSLPDNLIDPEERAAAQYQIEELNRLLKGEENHSVPEKPEFEEPIMPTHLSVGPTGIKTTPIGKAGETVFGETRIRFDGNKDLLTILRGNKTGARSDFFVANNKDIAVGQGDNTGAKITYKSDHLSGQENIKPGTGDLVGREYKTNYLSKDAISKIEIDKNKFNEEKSAGGDPLSSRGTQEIEKILSSDYKLVDSSGDKLVYEPKDKVLISSTDTAYPMPDGSIGTQEHADLFIAAETEKADTDQKIIDALAQCAIENLGSF